jgi:hypothetical protein
VLFENVRDVSLRIRREPPTPPPGEEAAEFLALKLEE